MGLVGSLALVAACASTVNGTPTSGSPTTSGAASSSSASASSSAPPRGKLPTHVSLNLGDGGQVGVGMPIIATFNHVITDGRAFQKATKVTVNGQPADGAWYFEFSDPASGHVMEAHYRLKDYWPAHAQIHMDLPVQGLSGGAVKGKNQDYVFDDSLTLSIATGAANILTVDNDTHEVTWVRDGKQMGTFPTSLGADNPSDRTKRGIKVIMERLPTVCMHDIAGTYYECGIKLDLRVTYDGEYLHAAPWNVYNITHGINSSNGCTNLLPADAATLYAALEIGDVVSYPNANGNRMGIGDGYGDWNVTWPLWQTGGVVPTQG